jgi:hypothetical protein
VKDSLFSLTKKAFFFIAKNVPLESFNISENNIISVQALKVIWNKQTTQVSVLDPTQNKSKPKASSPYSLFLRLVVAVASVCLVD